MPKIRRYTKTPLTLTELVEKLSSKGLAIENPKRVQRYLQMIGYYRLVGYGLAFEQYTNSQRIGRYQKGTNFYDLLEAYITDRKLRVLMLSAIERIEVAIRTIINQSMSERYQSAHWYLDKSLFKESKVFTHSGLLHEISRVTGKTALQGSEQEKQRDIFIHHYYEHYDEPEYPAAWMLAEVLSLGGWSRVFKHLKHSKDRKNIARQLDLSPITLESWLHSLVIIRNICAHHGRLFARKLSMPPKKDKQLPIQKNNYAMNYITICYWLLQKISPNTQWLNEIEKLFAESKTKNELFGVTESRLHQLKH